MFIRSVNQTVGFCFENLSRGGKSETLMTRGGGGGGLYNEVCFALCTLHTRGAWGHAPRGTFRILEITSGAFLSIVLLCCVELCLH